MENILGGNTKTCIYLFRSNINRKKMIKINGLNFQISKDHFREIFSSNSANMCKILTRYLATFYAIMIPGGLTIL